MYYTVRASESGVCSDMRCTVDRHYYRVAASWRRRGADGQTEWTDGRRVAAGLEGWRAGWLEDEGFDTVRYGTVGVVVMVVCKGRT